MVAWKEEAHTSRLRSSLSAEESMLVVRKYCLECWIVAVVDVVVMLGDGE
jgi:hypothetical protein